MDRTIRVFWYVELNMDRTDHVFWYFELCMDRAIHTLWYVDLHGLIWVIYGLYGSYNIWNMSNIWTPGSRVGGSGGADTPPGTPYEIWQMGMLYIWKTTL